MSTSSAKDDPDPDSLDELLQAVARAPVYDAAWSASAGPTVQRRDGARPLPQSGEIIDQKYRIDRVLGEGGMGVVYAATQLNTERKVALKWMRTDGLERTDAERQRAAARFAREARVVSYIDHPNRVEVYDVGGDPNHPYLVMELLHGQDLRARLDERGPLRWADALSLLRPVVELISAAHAAGIIHRDLKPDNLFLARQRDGSEVVKVLDFGISRLRRGELDEGPSLTQTGSILGTPAYMPLEQLRGQPKLDSRADIYALGVVLYEVLSGHRPYQARNVADYAALLSTDAPAPLSRHCPALRGEPERAVLRALARDPAERFVSVREFGEALERARPLASKVRIRHVALGLMVAMAATTALLIGSARVPNAPVPLSVDAHTPSGTAFASRVAPAFTVLPAQTPMSAALSHEPKDRRPLRGPLHPDNADPAPGRVSHDTAPQRGAGARLELWQFAPAAAASVSAKPTPDLASERSSLQLEEFAGDEN